MHVPASSLTGWAVLDGFVSLSASVSPQCIGMFWGKMKYHDAIGP